jgi:hypothetical protein
MNHREYPKKSVNDLQSGDVFNLAHSDFTEQYWGETYNHYYGAVKSTREYLNKSGEKTVEVSFTIDGSSKTFSFPAGHEVPLPPEVGTAA